MLKPIFYILTPFILISCSSKDEDVNLQQTVKNDTTLNASRILFGKSQIIDSTPYVIYPLILEKTSNKDSYGSSGGDGRIGYWNLIFYNTETAHQQLLTLDKKILIYSINIGSYSSSSSSDGIWTNRINILKSNIIYTVVSKDYNTNNKLDENDPGYLFVSSTAGTNFRQISPDDYNILSWDVIKGTSKIIMQGQKDNNGDKKFDVEDSLIPLVADLTSMKTAVQTFNASYIDSLKRTLISIWKK